MVAGAASLYASAFVHDADGTLTIVLVNAASSAATAQIQVPSMPAGITSFDGHTSQNGSLWQPSTFMVTSGAVSVPVPAYGVVSLQGTGTPVTPPGCASMTPSTFMSSSFAVLSALAVTIVRLSARNASPWIAPA